MLRVLFPWLFNRLVFPVFTLDVCEPTLVISSSTTTNVYKSISFSSCRTTNLEPEEGAPPEFCLACPEIDATWILFPLSDTGVFLFLTTLMSEDHFDISVEHPTPSFTLVLTKIRVDLLAANQLDCLWSLASFIAPFCGLNHQNCPPRSMLFTGCRQFHMVTIHGQNFELSSSVGCCPCAGLMPLDVGALFPSLAVDAPTPLPYFI